MHFTCNFFKSGTDSNSLKRKRSESEDSKDDDKVEEQVSSASDERMKSVESSKSENKPEKLNDSPSAMKMSPGLKCIGILPGLGSYDDSSDSDRSSSDSEHGFHNVKYDLVGRKILEPKLDFNLRDKRDCDDKFNRSNSK